jgi:hypothetical protein
LRFNPFNQKGQRVVKDFRREQFSQQGRKGHKEGEFFWGSCWGPLLRCCAAFSVVWPGLQSFLKHQTADAILEDEFVEIEEEAKRFLEELHIAHQLGLVDREELLDSLELKD